MPRTRCLASYCSVGLLGLTTRSFALMAGHFKLSFFFVLPAFSPFSFSCASASLASMPMTLFASFSRLTSRSSGPSASFAVRRSLS